MKSTSSILLAAALGLVVACAATSRADTAHDRTAQLRAAMHEAVPDPLRRAELERSIDEMEAAMLATIDEGTRLNREFVAASADPAADRAALAAIAARIAAARRDGMFRFLDARLALRRGMSADEWQTLASVLPAFDGGDA